MKTITSGVSTSLITLLTDFGTSDTYVAQMKAVILSRAPTCRLVDISHSVPPQDIRCGARMLAEVTQLFPIGSVHLCVIDPGVGTNRRLVAVEIGQQFYVLPDNGLLTDLVDGNAVVAGVELDRSQWWCGNVTRTFHGRDIMAPVAAHLASGVSLWDLGSELQSPPIRLPCAKLERIDDGFECEIVGFDTYGNILTNLPGNWLPEGVNHLHMQNGPSAPLVGCYGEAEGGKPVWVIGSQGRIELAVAGGSARQQFPALVIGTTKIRID
ncbi:MAG: SAM-dependent chlorinase/fluorinase [Planctomycetales bacterium]|nr:SAM-dependent chlorinase/fluorinase [Planctomycetales bacterium]